MVKRAKRLAEDEHITYIEAFLRIQQVGPAVISLDRYSSDDPNKQEVLDSQMDDDDSLTADDEDSISQAESLSLAEHDDDKSAQGDSAVSALEKELDDDGSPAEHSHNPDVDTAVETFMTAGSGNGVEPLPATPLRHLSLSVVEAAVSSAFHRLHLEVGAPPKVIAPAPKKQARSASVFVVSPKWSCLSYDCPNFLQSSSGRNQKYVVKQLSLQPSGSIPEYSPEDDAKGASSGRGGDVLSSRNSGEGENVVSGKQRVVLTVENLEEKSQSSNKSDGNPFAGLDSLPPYLLGGVDAAGFMHILGNALALLYVARHGLKESELWAMLSTIPKPGGGGDAANKHGKVPFTDEMKALVSVCYYYREKFRDVWKSNDSIRSGRLTPQKLLVGMQTVNPEFMQKDLDMLLVMLDCKPTQVG